MNPLHYVDVPRGATAYDRDRGCPQRNCIVEAITWYVNVLKSNHLVGDLFESLHVGFLDDVGGTKTKVTFHGIANPCKSVGRPQPNFCILKLS